MPTTFSSVDVERICIYMYISPLYVHSTCMPTTFSSVTYREYVFTITYDPYMWQKRPTYVAKETYYCGKRDLYHDKRDLHMSQKRPIPVAKQTYTLTKETYICRKRDPKQTYLPRTSDNSGKRDLYRDKRDLYMSQKRPNTVAKQTYLPRTSDNSAAPQPNIGFG